MTEIYGTIINQLKNKHKIFIITEYKGIYSLIEHDPVFDITDVLLRVSDLEFVMHTVKQQLKGDISEA